MAKYFMVSAMVPDTHLHDVMTHLAGVESLQIGAQPVPVDIGAMALQMAGGPIAQLLRPGQAPPKQLAKPQKKTKTRNDPSDELKLAITAAIENFLTSRATFKRNDFIAIMKKASRGAGYNPDARLAKLAEAGRIARVSTGIYRTL